MATGYEPHNWQCGDEITTTRLNNIEAGLEISQPWYFGRQGTGTCDGNSYTEYDITYNDISVYCSHGAPIVYFDSSTGITSTILCATTRVRSDHVYEATLGYLSGSQIETMTLYCDTIDGNMRDYNCWTAVS